MKRKVARWKEKGERSGGCRIVRGGREKGKGKERYEEKKKRRRGGRGGGMGGKKGGVNIKADGGIRQI